MEFVFKAWKTSRKIYLDFLDTYTLDQLNKVPQGFNNNLIWNIGHIVVAQQSLIYRTSNLPMYIPDQLFDLYKPGTRPSGATTQSEVDELRILLTVLIEKTEADYANGKFVAFNERITGTGFHLASLRDAFEFNNYHEGLHLGCMMSIRKFL